MTQQLDFESSLSDIDDFVKSPLWRDFQKVLAARVRVIHEIDMENPALNEDGLKRLQGELRGLRFWQLVPGDIAAELKREKEKEKKNERA